MADRLEEIIARTRLDVAERKKKAPLEKLKDNFKRFAPIRSFAQSLRQPGGLAVIAEFKQASPSAGVIRQEADVPRRLQGYKQGGAAALSILTEPHYFQGSPELLALARAQVDLPLLRKDFIVDHYQIDESRALGADAVLLIVSILGRSLLNELLVHAQEIELNTLVEVHDERDLEQAMAVEAPVIGVNNRNLRTLQVDLKTAQRLVPQIPPAQTIVVESGIREPGQLAALRQLGAHAVLIGEALMRDSNPEAIVKLFVEAGRGPLRKVS